MGPLRVEPASRLVGQGEENHLGCGVARAVGGEGMACGAVSACRRGPPETQGRRGGGGTYTPSEGGPRVAEGMLELAGEEVVHCTSRREPVHPAEATEAPSGGGSEEPLQGGGRRQQSAEHTVGNAAPGYPALQGRRLGSSGGEGGRELGQAVRRAQLVPCRGEGAAKGADVGGGGAVGKRTPMSQPTGERLGIVDQDGVLTGSLGGPTMVERAPPGRRRGGDRSCGSGPRKAMWSREA